MQDSEFVKRMIPLLDAMEYKQVISHSISRGFIIPGFSNSKRNNKVSIPMSLVTSTGVLCKKVNKDKYNYQILFDVMKTIAQEKKDDESIMNLVVKWANDESTHSDIEDEIASIEMSFDNQDLKKYKSDKITHNKTSINEKVEKNISQLNDEMLRIKDKNKKYKEELQGNKIEIDNLKQQKTKLEKEKEKIQEEKDLLQNKFEGFVREHNIQVEKLEQNLASYKKEIIELNEQIRVLQQYKAIAPHILCITKSKKELDFPGYDISYISETNNLEETYLAEEYNYVWYLRKGFNHSDLIYIKNIIPKEKLIQARDENDLADKVKGGRV